MTTMQKLTHGEPQWETKVNAIIDYLLEGHALDEIKVTDWSTEGLVLNSNCKWLDNSKGYRYVQLPGVKLIELDLKFSIGSYTGEGFKQAVTIPDFISSEGQAVDFAHVNGAIFATFADNQVQIQRFAGDTKDAWNVPVYGHAFYYHKD